MNYKLAKDENGQDRTDCVIRIDDAGIISWIPADLRNTSWSTYQAWLADGNEPQAADSE